MILDNRPEDTAIVNLDSLDKLARLLAIEDIAVEHGPVPSAFFDIKNRVLMLPMWKNVTKPLYHMLVLHEVGHALYTELGPWEAEVKKDKKFAAYINIVEDARIERLMKDRYPGGRRDFRIGYQQLFDRDFFQLDKHPIAKMGLPDRLNAQFKIGHLVDVPFYNSVERDFIRKFETTVTIQDVIRVARELYEYCKQNGQGQGEDEEEQEGDSDGDGEGGEGNGRPKSGPPSASNRVGAKADKFDPDQAQQGSSGGGMGAMADSSGLKNEDIADGLDTSKNSGGGEGDDQGEDGSQSKADGEQGDGDQDSNGGGEDDGKDADKGEADKADASKQGGLGEGEAPEILTADKLAEGIASMASNVAKPMTYYNVDVETDFSQWVIPYKAVLDTAKLNGWWTTKIAGNSKRFDEVRKKNETMVNVLVQEFEMRKAADKFQRSREAKTGVINPSRLHSYRYADDIFRRTTVAPNGKNHAIAMFIDFSGSMSQNMPETVEQLYNLVMFCRKVGIAHRVYAFTDNGYVFNCFEGVRKNTTTVAKILQKRRDYNTSRRNKIGGNLVVPQEGMNLLELYHEKMTLTEFRHMTELLLRQFGALAMDRVDFAAFRLHGTPLDSAITLSFSLLKDLKQSSKAEIVSGVYLTDGESGGTVYVDQMTGSLGSFHSVSSMNIVRNRKTGKTYRGGDENRTFGIGYTALTDIQYQMLRDEGFHVIGYRVGSKRELTQEIENHADQLRKTNSSKQKMEEQFRVNRCATAENYRGLDQQHFLIMDTSKVDYYGNRREVMEEEARRKKEVNTKGGLQKRFVADRVNRINSRVILKKFAAKVANK